MQTIKSIFSRLYPHEPTTKAMPITPDKSTFPATTQDHHSPINETTTTKTTASSSATTSEVPVGEIKQRQKKRNDEKKYERIVGPHSRATDEEWAEFQLYTFGEQNDAYINYTRQDFNEDMEFYGFKFWKQKEAES